MNSDRSCSMVYRQSQLLLNIERYVTDENLHSKLLPTTRRADAVAESHLICGRH
jgi:hypothetical protein